jgi:hypothetical protein
MKASLDAHALAGQTEDPVYKAVARSAGHTAASAHMADHSLGGAYYALKAVKLADKDLKKEREWQLERSKDLPSELMKIIQDMWIIKNFDGRI